MTEKDRPVRASMPPDGRAPEEQPRWRRDFPIDVPVDQLVARRDFAKFLVLTSGAFAAGQLLIAVESIVRPERTSAPSVRIAELASLPIGAVLPFSYPTDRDPCLLVRLGEDELVAYDRRCTHLMCPVFAEPEQGRLHCPCHRGYFDLAGGRPIAGPPRRPLTRILLRIEDGVVFATGVEVRTT